MHSIARIRSASAPIQQALRTHLDEAAELLRDLRDCTTTIVGPKYAGTWRLHFEIAATANGKSGGGRAVGQSFLVAVIAGRGV